MTNLEDLVAADRRLRILQLLEKSTDFTASVDLLRTVLAQMGHAVSHVRLDADLTLLMEAGLVGLERIGDGREGVPLARVTARGVDVAMGLASMPGVARPRPE